MAGNLPIGCQPKKSPKAFESSFALRCLAGGGISLSSRGKMLIMKHWFWVASLFLLLGCSAPTGQEVISLDERGLRPAAKGQAIIPWSDIEALHLEMHPISEQESAPLLVVTVEGRPLEVCAAYPHRVDPKSYAGAHHALSVSKESFLQIRDTIVSAAGLVPDEGAEGRWVKGQAAPNLTVEPASFSHGYAAAEP